MTTSLIVLETRDLVAAARLLRLWVAAPLATSTDALARALEGCGGMAGDDPGGQAWAAAYDRAAVRALDATAEAVNGVDRLADMFAQTARNYEAADAASTASSPRLVEASVDTLPAHGGYYGLPVCVPPSAAGGGSAPPAGWGLVAHAVGYVWPHGHQDRLRAAAAAWTGSAAALQHAADDVFGAPLLAITDRLPEAEDMGTVCRATTRQLEELAALHRALGAACAELAGHLDAAHAAVEAELASLVEWTAGIELAGGLLSVVSLGLAEVPAQAGAAARIAAAAARVSRLIEGYVALARAAGGSVAALTERADRVAAELVGLSGTRLTTAMLTQVKLTPTALRLQEQLAIRRLGVLGGDVPPLTMTRAQLEQKFKHAADFGVGLGRSRRGFDAFGDAVERFLARPQVRHVIGSYRGRQVMVSYDAKTRLAVVQDLDGTFIIGWQLDRIQFLHVIRDRRLGGG